MITCGSDKKLSVKLSFLNIRNPKKCVPVEGSDVTRCVASTVHNLFN